MPSNVARSDFVQDRAAAGILLLRVIVGIAFVVHGWPKIHHPMSWMGPAGFAPGWLQACAAVAEFFGGVALIAGILTPVAAFLILCDMAVALFRVEIPSGAPFVGRGHTWELPAVYFVAMMVLLLTGPGAISVDAFVFSGHARSRSDEAESEAVIPRSPLLSP